MTNDLTAAVAEIQSISIKAMPFRSSDFEGFTQVMGNAVATILNAVASGALVPAADVQGLVEAVKALNAACDAMWNDHARLEPNPSRFGQKYRLKEAHMRAISEAQQKLPDALTAWENRK